MSSQFQRPIWLPYNNHPATKTHQDHFYVYFSSFFILSKLPMPWFGVYVRSVYTICLCVCIKHWNKIVVVPLCCFIHNIHLFLHFFFFLFALRVPNKFDFVLAVVYNMYIYLFCFFSYLCLYAHTYTHTKPDHIHSIPAKDAYGADRTRANITKKKNIDTQKVCYIILIASTHTLIKMHSHTGRPNIRRIEVTQSARQQSRDEYKSVIWRRRSHTLACIAILGRCLCIVYVPRLVAVHVPVCICICIRCVYMRVYVCVFACLLAYMHCTHCIQ